MIKGIYQFVAFGIMMKNNIFSILKYFSKEELKRLTAFLESPYLNKSKKLISFYHEIIKHYPDFAFENLNKEELIKQFSTRLKYNDSTFRNLIFDLTGIVEKFLILEKLSEDDWENNVFLLKSLSERKNEFLFVKNLNKANLELEQRGIDSTYFYDRSQIDMSKFNYNILNLSEKSFNNIESNTSIISSYVINLVIFFITEIINSYFHLSVHEINYNLPDKKNQILKLIQILNPEEIYDHLKKTSDKAYFIKIYITLLDSFLYMEKPENYHKYKSMVLKYSKCFSKDELSYHFSMLISYCVLKNSITKYRSYMDRELFNIYNIILKEKYFLDRKSIYLDDSLYRNMIILSLRLKKYKWNLDFIAEYSKYLHPDKFENLKNLAYTEYYFYSGSDKGSSELLETASGYIAKIQDESFIIKYDVKVLNLMLNFDKGFADEKMITQLNSYRKFLSRNKLVSENRKNRVNRFLNIFEKLIFLKGGNRNIDISELHAEIFSSEGLNHIQWLLDKVHRIETTNLKLKSS